MANNYFKFKEFTIIQEVCAMKVCTDSCLFGAWVTENIICKDINNILDIGTGTGLLSLMLVQKNQHSICDAIEIDKDTSEEANRNFEGSKWSDRFNVFNLDYLSYKPADKYDLVICNPPFYEHQLNSPDTLKNAAMHSSNFSINDLFYYTKSIVSDKGYLACLIPWIRTVETIESAKRFGWVIKETCYVKQTTKHHYFRSMLIFSTLQSETIITEITIKDNNLYTKEFIELLKDFYLIFQ